MNFKLGDVIIWGSGKNGVILLILNVNLLEKNYTTVFLNKKEFHANRVVSLSFDGARQFYVNLKDKKLNEDV